MLRHPWIQRRPGLRQFVKFGIVGAGNTAVDFGLYLLLTRLVRLQYLSAHGFSFVGAVTLSYVLNKRWTFRDERRPVLSRQLAQFLLVSIVGAGLSSLTLFGLVQYGGLPDVVAKLLAIVLVLFWNFFANKHWTFRPS